MFLQFRSLWARYFDINIFRLIMGRFFLMCKKIKTSYEFTVLFEIYVMICHTFNPKKAVGSI